MLLLTYMLAAAAASAAFMAVGWRSTWLASAHRSVRFFARPEAIEPEAATPGRSTIDAALDTALERLGPIIARHQVKLQLAVQPDLIAPLRSSVIADILKHLVSSAIDYAAGGQLLLTAWESQGRIAIRLIDDVVRADRSDRERSVNSLTELVARYGGSLELNVQPTGTIITIWLAAVGPSAADSE